MQNRVIKPEDYLSYSGKNGLILWFYPKAGSLGCSMEAAYWNKRADDFKKLGYNIVGVSVDDTKDNDEFSIEQDLSFPLVSDADKTLVNEYSVWGEKSKYGLPEWSVVRSTFVLDPKGNIIWEGRDVHPTEHIDEVYQALKDRK